MATLREALLKNGVFYLQRNPIHYRGRGGELYGGS